MLRFPVHTRNFRTSCITVAVAPPKEVGVGRNESVPISRNSPSINIGGPNRPKRVSSAAYLSRPYLDANNCTQPPLSGAEGSSIAGSNMPAPCLVGHECALGPRVLSDMLYPQV